MDADDVRESRHALLPLFHPEVRKVAGQLWLSGYDEQAMKEAWTPIRRRLQQVSNLTDEPPDGIELIHTVLGGRGTEPKIDVRKYDLRKSSSEVPGVRDLVLALWRTYRNPLHHNEAANVDLSEAFEVLMFSSLILKRLDHAAMQKGIAGHP